MHQRDLARLLVKIAALVIIVTALTDLPDALIRVWPLSRGMTVWGVVGRTFAPASVSILAGLAMFWWAGPIVDRALVNEAPGTKDAVVDLSGFEEIALTALGIYILTAGLAQALYYWAKWDFYNHYVAGLRGSNPTILPTEFGGFFAAGTRIVLGIPLILGSRSFIVLKRRVLGFRPMRVTTIPPSSLL
jgi:hypothetical protein